LTSFDPNRRGAFPETAHTRSTSTDQVDDSIEVYDLRMARRDLAKARRDLAKARRDLAKARRDLAKARRYVMIDSIIWKFHKPFRAIKSFNFRKA